jgi:excisionase family DNA binding protein
MAKPAADLDDFGDMLSLPDVAKILGVHINTAQRYARQGVIPTHRLPGGRRYYVLKDELLDFIRAQPANPAPTDQPVPVKPRESGSDSGS